MSLLKEVLSNMVRDPKDWGIGGLDKTDMKARRGDAVTIPFTTFLQQRNAAEEEEQTEEPELATMGTLGDEPQFQSQAAEDCMSRMQGLDAQASWEYLWDKIEAGELNKEQFLELMSNYVSK